MLFKLPWCSLWFRSISYLVHLAWLASRRYSQLIGGLPKARAYCCHSPLSLIAVMRWAPSCQHLRKLGPRPHKAPEATWTLLFHTERWRTEALAGRTYLLLVPKMLAGYVSSMRVRCIIKKCNDVLTLQASPSRRCSHLAHLALPSLASHISSCYMPSPYTLHLFLIDPWLRFSSIICLVPPTV